MQTVSMNNINLQQKSNYVQPISLQNQTMTN